MRITGIPSSSAVATASASSAAARSASPDALRLRSQSTYSSWVSAITGRLFQAGTESPHVGSILGYLKGPKGDIPPHVLLPRPIGNTGGGMPHGQTAGFLGKLHDPFVLGADPPPG